MSAVLRRVHAKQLSVGRIELDPAGSRHGRDVLRLAAGDEVEMFDDAGGVARGVIESLEPRVAVRVEAVDDSGRGPACAITVAAAVPKGDRADWMVEKLSEVGVSRFMPLATARSVVLPEGRNKRDRWTRIATESAKQSRRRGVMRVDDLTKLADAIAPAPATPAPATPATLGPRALVLSTEPTATPILDTLRDNAAPGGVTLFIGPEGGWTDEELALFRQRDVAAIKLTDTILRVETAAVVAAALVAVSFNPNSRI